MKARRKRARERNLLGKKKIAREIGLLGSKLPKETNTPPLRNWPLSLKSLKLMNMKTEKGQSRRIRIYSMCYGQQLNLQYLFCFILYSIHFEQMLRTHYYESMSSEQGKTFNGLASLYLYSTMPKYRQQQQQNRVTTENENIFVFSSLWSTEPPHNEFSLLTHSNGVCPCVCLLFFNFRHYFVHGLHLYEIQLIQFDRRWNPNELINGNHIQFY